MIEYKVEKIMARTYGKPDRTEIDLATALNTRALDGWQLVTLHPTDEAGIFFRCVFVRPVV